MKDKEWDEYYINFYANYWYLPKDQNRNKSNKHPKKFFEDIRITDKKLKKLFINSDLLNFHRYSTFIEDRSGKIRKYISSSLEIKKSDYSDEES